MNRSGLPSLEELARGSICATRNAEELLDEAKLLFSKGHYARGYALAMLCNEEIGKAMIISRLIYTDISDSKGLKSFWARFHSHHSKLGDSMMLLAWDAADTASWRWVRKNLTELKKAHQSLKESSLYVNYENDRFTLPSDVFLEPRLGVGAQIMLSETILQLMKKRFSSEEIVTQGFRKMRAVAKRAGHTSIKYDDAKTLMSVIREALRNPPPTSG